jgi:hypothetical protein
MLALWYLDYVIPLQANYVIEIPKRQDGCDHRALKANSQKHTIITLLMCILRMHCLSVASA